MTILPCGLREHVRMPADEPRHLGAGESSGDLAAVDLRIATLLAVEVLEGAPEQVGFVAAEDDVRAGACAQQRGHKRCSVPTFDEGDAREHLLGGRPGECHTVIARGRGVADAEMAQGVVQGARGAVGMVVHGSLSGFDGASSRRGAGARKRDATALGSGDRIGCGACS